MFTKRKTIRFIAIFLLLNFIFDLALPSISWALTSGPTTPEVSTFEPVDTSDMVNISSGDFVYNVPLLEVPGPSGGFPISMAYHAGIMPNQEASWVGLGWNINTGVINRSINGIPDDFEGINSTTRTFWSGGETNTYSVGVNIGIFGGPHISAGVQVANDTYKGTGVGFSVGASLSFGIGGDNSRVGGGVNASVGISPYGGTYASVGAGVGIGLGSKLAANIGIGGTIHSKAGASGYVGGGVSYSIASRNDKDMSTSLIGGSLSVGGGRFNASGSIGGGRINNINSRSGNVSVSTSGFGIEVPVYFGVSLSFSKQRTRYWIDETENVLNNGALYFPNSSDIDLDNNQYDIFSISKELDDHYEPKDPNTNGFGTMPDFDNYQVLGQGINGSIRPYYYKKGLLRRNSFSVKTEDEEEVRTNKILQKEIYDTQKPTFRFIGDFSNKILSDIQEEGMEIDADNIQFSLADGFDTFFYNETNNQLPGSRNIEFYTNSEIAARNKPIIVNDNVYEVFEDSDIASLIGGFLITNESGVNYHFALPAYEMEEYQFSGNKNEIDEFGDDRQFNEYKNPDKYAYAWHMTAITGADYVDRPPRGLGEEDWGYWVEFNYGKWTENYAWRNPSNGYNVDLDQRFRNYSSGKKEIYYLDYIRTKTHTALFQKSIRSDGKSLCVLKNSDKKIDQGFYPFIDEETGEYAYPVSVLKLDKITLIHNDDLNQLLASSGLSNLNELKAQGLNFTNGSSIEENKIVIHRNESVLLSTDLDFLGTDLNTVSQKIQEKSLRSIVFDSNYSLADNTINSFDHELLYTSNPPQSQNVYDKSGKLTLKRILIHGKQGVRLLPSTVFDYDLENPESGRIIAEDLGDREIGFSSTEFEFDEGDLLKIKGIVGEYNAVIIDKKESNDYIALLTGGDRAVENYGGEYFWQYTKNPVFDGEAYNSWMQFKSDYYHSENKSLENLRRFTTEISAKSVDAWSLREVATPTGGIIGIEYQCDEYSESAYPNNISFPIKNQVVLDVDLNIVQFNLDVDVLDFAKLVSSTLFDGNIELWLPILVEYTPSQTCNIDALVGTHFEFLNGDPCQTYRVNSSNVDMEIYKDHIIVDFDDDLSIFRSRDYYQLPDICQDMWFNYEFQGGNVVLNNSEKKYGGGLQTTSIKVHDPMTGKSNVTNYSYTQIIDPNRSSGTTSYEPGTINEPNVSYFYSYDTQNETVYCYDDYIYHFKLENVWDANEFARFIPAPSILYEYVKVTDEIIHPNGHIEKSKSSSVYNFQKYNKGMVQVVKQTPEEINYPQPEVVTLQNEYTPSTPTDLFPEEVSLKKKIASNYQIKNYIQNVGRLKSIALLDEKGNKVTETIYQFLVDENENDFGVDYEAKIADSFDNIGVVHESYVEQRLVNQDDDYKEIGVFTKLETYPAISVGEININYKTGIQNYTKTLQYDLYSGMPTKTLTVDSYGNYFLTEKTPAYRKYPEMGLPGITGGKNMLVQDAANYTYLVSEDYEVEPVNPANKLGLVSGSAQTWSPNIRANHEAKPLMKIYNEKITDDTYRLEDLNASLDIGMEFRYPYSVDEFRKGKVISELGNSEYEVWLEMPPAIPYGSATTLEGTFRNVYSKKSTYTWKGDNIDLFDDEVPEHEVRGYYPISDFVEFDAWYDHQIPQSDQWQLNSEVTLVDVYSHALEAKDINGQFAATKMDARQERVFATVANARYDEFAYAGAEDEVISDGNNLFWGGVYLEEGMVDNTVAHTGSNSMTVAEGKKTLQFGINNPGNDHDYYRASVWTNSPQGQLAYSLDGGAVVTTSVSESLKAGDWYLINIDIPVVSATTLSVYCQSVSGTINFDDFRVHPLDAAMTSYVYNEWGELSHTIGANNFYTEYVYDKMGRLDEVWNEVLDEELPGDLDIYPGKIRSSKNKIHYARGLE